MKIEPYISKYILTLDYETEQTVKTFYREEDLLEYMEKHSITNEIIYDLRKIENYRILD